MKIILTILFILSISLSSCQEETEISNNDPANLVVESSISSENPGAVEINAVADNTSEYHFYTGETSTEDPIKNSTGNFTHTYSTSGIYNAEIRAIGEAERYVKKELKFTISIEEEVFIDEGYTSPLSYEGMTLLWNDEFASNSLNLSDWTHEIGTGSGGWGNNESQYYRAENTTVSDGLLTIEARQENFSSNSYTSSRIITKGKQKFKYGRVDIRAKLPYGKGIWPALWMLGENISSVGWPKCGEIDIMEMVGGSTDNKVHGTVHWESDAGYANYGDSYNLNSGIFADEFHVFSMVWTASSITWYVDDIYFNSVNTTPSHLSEFQEEFFFIFNVAVGGNWPGYPDATTTFPQQMQVDYIRVFQDN